MKRLKINGAKTEGETLLSSFACADIPDIAAWQFLQRRDTGHMDKSKSNTLAHHLIQSFLPGEVDPDKDHQIGKKLADEYLGGKYQYVIATHGDKGHIHNHIIFNAISFTDRKWYKSYKKTYYLITKSETSPMNYAKKMDCISFPQVPKEEKAITSTPKPKMAPAIKRHLKKPSISSFPSARIMKIYFPNTKSVAMN